MVAIIDKLMHGWARSRVMCPRNIQYACAAGGILTLPFAALALAASGFLPPISPAWDAERTVRHYRSHEKGIQVGAMLLFVAGIPYLAMTAIISEQMQRIPGLPPVVATLQQIAGAAGACITFMLPGIILAVASYRLDRHVEITQALNNLFWFMLLISWPPAFAQAWVFAYAIIIDSRPNPLSPKSMAILNIVLSILYTLSSAMHCVKTGPLAWNGALTFWVPLIAFAVQVIADFITLARAVSTEPVLSAPTLNCDNDRQVQSDEAQHQTSKRT